MRTTVGPLPSAVYWRRRVVVLGAILLGIIVLFVSCSGDDKPSQRTGASSPTSQAPTPATGDGSSDPSFLGSQPPGDTQPAPGDAGGQDSDEDDGGVPAASGVPTLGSGQNANVEAPSSGACTDQEISVTPVAAAGTLKRGGTLEIGMKIKNTSNRTCSRDVGAGPQELYLDQGPTEYWSSDTCSTDKSSNIRPLKAGEELEYKVTWIGRQSSSCAAGQPNGPVPPPGQFQLRARLGSLRSEPVNLTITS